MPNPKNLILIFKREINKLKYKRDIDKIYEYIKENNSSIDYKNIAKLMSEINKWQDRNKEYLLYVTDIINAIKGQLKEVDAKSNDLCFTIKEVMDKIMLLMAFEIKKNKCDFIKQINTDASLEINGEINSLIQVLNNIINNAIEASTGDKIVALKVYKEHSNIIFSVKNFGKKFQIIYKKSYFKRWLQLKARMELD